MVGEGERQKINYNLRLTVAHVRTHSVSGPSIENFPAFLIYAHAIHSNGRLFCAAEYSEHIVVCIALNHSTNTRHYHLAMQSRKFAFTSVALCVCVCAQWKGSVGFN